MLFYRLFGGLCLLKSGTHRTFPVLRNILGKVPLFLMSSVSLFKGGDREVMENLYFPHFSAILYLLKLKKYINLRKSN